ncbi:MAG: TlpA disulfide reductase family protein [Pseudomonadota bacterium]
MQNDPTDTISSRSTTAATAASPALKKSTRRKRFVILAAVIGLAIAALAYRSLNVKDQAPDVMFTSLAGERISMQSLRGKVVMVNFWATSCVTCVKEMPQMVETYTKFKGRGLDFIAVAMSYDPPNYVINFTETRKLPFTVALDTQNTLAKSFGDVTLTPTTFVIDKKGRIIKRYVGEPDFDALHRLLDQATASI